MDKRRYLNVGVIFIIVSTVIISMVICGGFDSAEILLAIITSAIMAFVTEYKITLSIMKQYDDMKWMNGGSLGGGASMPIPVCRVLCIMAILNSLIGTFDGSDDFIFGQIIFISIIIFITNIERIHVGDTYIHMQNKFIKIEDIRGFSYREIKSSNKLKCKQIELAIETLNDKVYYVTFMPYMKKNIEKLKEVLSGEVIIDYSQYME